MREADVAIRLRQPTQPDLIQRKLFSVRFHAYASPEYPQALRHAQDARGSRQAPHPAARRHVVPNHFVESALADRGRAQWQGPARACAHDQQCPGHHACLPAAASVSPCCRTIWSRENGGLVQLFGESDSIALDAYSFIPKN
jgi:DNA-binding transcriptional LysR family regulator